MVLKAEDPTIFQYQTINYKPTEKRGHNDSKPWEDWHDTQGFETKNLHPPRKVPS